jgi:hypothetical protein
MSGLPADIVRDAVEAGDGGSFDESDDTPHTQPWPDNGDSPPWQTHNGRAYPPGMSDEQKDDRAHRSKIEADQANENLQAILDQNPDALSDDLDEMTSNETIARLGG